MRVFGFALALGALLVYPSFGYANEGRESIINEHAELSLQNKPVRHIDLDHINQNISPTVNVLNSAVSVNGGYLYYGDGNCYEVGMIERGLPPIRECGLLPSGSPQIDISTVTDQQIEHKFKLYLTDVYGLPEEDFDKFTGTIILDFEHPVNLGHEGLNHPEWIEPLAGEFNRRARIVKQVLTNPEMEVALYGTHIAKINENHIDARKRMDALVNATLAGMYDSVDYIAFPLYQSKGPGDFGHIRAYERAPAKQATNGLEGAMIVSLLSRMRGNDVKPWPQLNLEMLGSYVGQPVDPEWMKRVIKVIKDYGVERYGYWHAEDITPEDQQMITNSLLAIYKTDGRLAKASGSSSTGD